VPRGQVKVGTAGVGNSISWKPALLVDGKRIALSVGTTSVGRDQSADIAIDDRGLSRVHFEIAWNGEVAAIRDSQSTNGTFVDGVRISQVVLRGGSVITAGRSEFVFELVAQEAAQ
jgi:pSer/pThr/pTyr-binding forkhead associated (FHA) protein